MTLQAVSGLYFPPLPRVPDATTAFNASNIGATNSHVAMVGTVGKSGNVSRVGFRFGTVTKAGGSGLTVSLQDLATGTGQPNQPDGTQDQTVAIANGNSSFASNTWIRTDALSASRTVTAGDLLAVVVEFDGSGRLGSDSVDVSTLASIGGSSTHLPGVRTKAGSTWSAAGSQPVVVLEYDDGTFSTFDGCQPFVTYVSTAYQSGSTPDENALRFTVPWKCKTDGCWIHMAVNGGSADFEIVLYEGTTALATVAMDAGAAMASTGTRELFGRFSEQTLTPNTVYYLALKPTTANSVTLKQFDVSAAAHLQAWPGGDSLYAAGRTDAGSWSTTTTRLPAMGLRISALDDGAGGSGGLMRHPGMVGGMVG